MLSPPISSSIVSLLEPELLLLLSWSSLSSWSVSKLAIGLGNCPFFLSGIPKGLAPSSFLPGMSNEDFVPTFAFNCWKESFSVFCFIPGPQFHDSPKALKRSIKPNTKGPLDAPFCDEIANSFCDTVALSFTVGNGAFRKDKSYVMIAGSLT